jgi:hypothetical protein
VPEELDDEDDEPPVPFPDELLSDDPDAEPEPLPDEVDPGLVLVVDAWDEPGRVAATAPVASTLANPAPAVTAVSRLIPRRRSSGGGSVWPPCLLDIGAPLLGPASGPTDTDDAPATGRKAAA